MSNPNWADIDKLKGPLYLGLKDTDLARDEALIDLGETITDAMIAWLTNNELDINNPPLALQRACLQQCSYAWRQRNTPGLTSVTFTDGTINKFSAEEFLDDVQRILYRHKKYILFETVPS